MTKRAAVFGSIREIPTDVEKSRTIPFIFSTSERDRYGTVLNQAGWRLKNYRLNPVVTYAHSRGGMLSEPNPDYVIGKASDLAVEGIGSSARLVGSIQFEGPENPLAEKIFRKVLFGSLSSTSVAFIEEGIGRYGAGEEARYGRKETYYLEAQELLEISVVNIPGNPSAGKRSKRTLADSSLASALMFAVTKLANAGWRPSEVEKLDPEAAELFIQAAELEFYSKDLKRIMSFLSDPDQVSIQKDRIAYRIQRDILHIPNPETDPIKREIWEHRRVRGIKIEKR